MDPNAHVTAEVWGLPQSGKSMLLFRLLQDAVKTERWRIIPNESTRNFWTAQHKRGEENRYPAATATELEVLDLDFVGPANQRARVKVRDRPGRLWEAMGPEQVQLLASADAILVLLDPLTEGRRVDLKVARALEEIFVERCRLLGVDVVVDSRPIALCLTKVDSLIRNAEEYASVGADSGRDFVADWIRRYFPKTAARLDQLFPVRQYFALSAAGVFVRYGLVEPGSVIDESQTERFCDGGTSINSMAPFVWALEKAAGQKGPSTE